MEAEDFSRTMVQCGDIEVCLAGITPDNVGVMTQHFFATNQFDALQRFTRLVYASDSYRAGRIDEARESFEEALTLPTGDGPRPDVRVPSWSIIIGLPALVLIVAAVLLFLT